MNTSAPSTHVNDSRRGVLMMLCAVGIFAVLDAMLKHLAASYSTLQVAGLRAAASLPFVLALVAWRGSWHALAPRHPMLHLLRGLLGIVMLTLFVYAVSAQPLTQVYAIYMIAPLLIVALAAVLLKEPVDTGRWLAIAVGMLGVWTILRPDTAGFVFWASLAAFVSALCYALSALIARRLTSTDSSESLMFSFLGIMALVCLVAALPNWRAIASADWGWILGIGATGAVAQYLLTEAFRYAGAAVLAPMEYTALLWGLALDWAIWSALPAPIVYLGAALVVGAGLYVMQRERRVAATQS